ncbi:hypothetical protein FRB93_011591 [Tulasnella sp. JGI-2019a]|nr:hypothetical protein FRB93_011591 [Tulasnella sp. JGI-2019a]
MKNAADFSGADVVPTSWTDGMLEGKGVGSKYGVTSTSLAVCADIKAVVDESIVLVLQVLEMPKIVSSTAVVSSTEVKPTESSTAALKTDGAIIIRCRDSPAGKGAVFKLNATQAGPLMIKRSNGYERQWRYTCPRCSLPVAYQNVPHPIKSGPYIYVIWGAMTMMQGKVPQEAWEGEDEVHEGMDEA